jgi:hypothetical protein
MKSTVSTQNVASITEKESNEQFQQYLAKQHPIVRGLHMVLQIFSLLCIAIAVYFFFAALYHTYTWATTGNLPSLNAWMNFGFSMSFLVFPWGLDSMLMRTFPAIIFPVSWYRSPRPITYKTGIGTIFAGFGIMCAGAPGAAIIPAVIWQFIQSL